jgi:hypothetical protein
MLDFQVAEVTAKLYYKDLQNPEFLQATKSVGKKIYAHGIHWTIINAAPVYSVDDGGYIGLVELYHEDKA